VTEWLLIPLGLFVGAYGTLIGAGGGFLLVPALLFLYPSAKPSTITSISLATVFFNAVAGSVAYGRAQRIDYRTGVTFAVATVPGAVLGAIVVTAIPRNLFSAIFGVVLIALAALVILRPQQNVSRSLSMRSGMTTRVMVDSSGSRYEYHFNLWQGLLLSVVVGFISSLLGIGGGIIMVPAMILLLDFPAHIATATSQFVLAVMALAGTSVHLITGELAFGSGLRRALLLAAGVIPGALIGAWLSRHIHGRLIVRMLGGALLVVGVRLLAGLFYA